MQNDKKFLLTLRGLFDKVGRKLTLQKYNENSCYAIFCY